MSSTILVQPIGTIDERLLERTRAGLEKAFPNTNVQIMEPKAVPERSHDDERGQYKSQLILEDLLSHFKSRRGQVLLGVADVDAYAGGLNFVFGEALMGDRIAVIYLRRLRQEFYGGPANEELFFERTLKEAVHEIGHTLGLGHCSDPRCVMYFSNSVIDTDFKSWRFCDRCYSRALKAPKA